MKHIKQPESWHGCWILLSKCWHMLVKGASMQEKGSCLIVFLPFDLLFQSCFLQVLWVIASGVNDRIFDQRGARAIIQLAWREAYVAHFIAFIVVTCLLGAWHCMTHFSFCIWILERMHRKVPLQAETKLLCWGVKSVRSVFCPLSEDGFMAILFAVLALLQHDSDWQGTSWPRPICLGLVALQLSNFLAQFCKKNSSRKWMVYKWSADICGIHLYTPYCMLHTWCGLSVPRCTACLCWEGFPDGKSTAHAHTVYIYIHTVFVFNKLYTVVFNYVDHNLCLIPSICWLYLIATYCAVYTVLSSFNFAANSIRI